MTYEASSNPSTKIERNAGSASVLKINDFTSIPTNAYQADNTNSVSTTFSTAKLSLERSNGVDPSTVPIGLISEINFNSYSAPSNGGPGMHKAVSIECHNAGDKTADFISHGNYV